MSDSIKGVIIRILYNNSNDLDISEANIELLNSLSVDVVIPILLDIHDRQTDIYVRARAFCAIMALRDFDKVAFLIDTFDSAPVEWKYNACYELRYFQDARAVAKLCAILLEESTPNLRYVAAESLADFDDLAAIQALEYARDHDTGEDYEGVPISETAKWSLDKIRSRADRV